MGKNVPTPTAKYVSELAASHGVRYQLTYGDVWAHHVTRLSGDEVHTDDTENLLVALARAGKISGAEMTRLTVTHLREKKAAEAARASPGSDSKDASGPESPKGPTGP